ncbi:MAG: hypothetical protein ACLQU4_12080 [Limisphaerales bacterium]
MNTRPIPITVLATATALLQMALCQKAYSNGRLDEAGVSILAPAVTPAGGFAADPQEYLRVSWLVVENASDVYTYSYTVQNPTGDVHLNGNGTSGTTPEAFNFFFVDFNTTLPGAYVSGSQSGTSLRKFSSDELAWFFAPGIGAGSSSTTVSFESDLPPTWGRATAGDIASRPPWSAVFEWGAELPVPGIASVSGTTAIPEPTTTELMFVAGSLAGVFCQGLKRWLRWSAPQTDR